MRVLILFLLIGFLQAQDLKGKWINIDSEPGYEDFMNLASFNGGVYEGDSYDASGGGAFCKYTFRAKYDAEKNEFLGYDDVLIDKTSNHSPVVYRLKYRKEGNLEYLEGYGRIINEDGSLDYPFRTTYYKESPEPIIEASPEDVAIIKKYKETRQNPVKANIRLKNKMVKIKVHDYGKEDHDSISIIYNDELLAYKIPIDSQVEEFKIEMQPGVNNRLTFIANNLGDVAPNTTYVEILADDKVFKYTLFTDLKKNAVINLKLQD